MRTLVDFLIEQKKRNEKYFLNYRKYANWIKKELAEKKGGKELESLRVIVFGSVPKGTWIPNKSDIDILIISPSVSKSATWQSDLKLEILRALGDLTAPFEFHFATPEEYRNWFEKFIGNEYVEVSG